MEILNKFSLNNPYRFCMYLSSLILVTSMFTEPVNIDVYLLRKLCFKLIVLGLIIWIIDNLYYNYLLEQRQYSDDEYTYNEESNIKYKNFKIGLNILYLFIGLLMI